MGQEMDRKLNRLPPASLETPEIHPGDFVILTEKDEFYIGNLPVIQQAARDKTPMRVLGKCWTILSERERRAFGKDAMYEVKVAHPNWSQPLLFWESCIKKVGPEMWEPKT